MLVLCWGYGVSDDKCSWRWAVGYGKGVEGRFHIVSQADQYLFIHDYSAVRMCCVCNEIPSREYQ